MSNYNTSTQMEAINFSQLGRKPDKIQVTDRIPQQAIRNFPRDTTEYNKWMV